MILLPYRPPLRESYEIWPVDRGQSQYQPYQICSLYLKLSNATNSPTCTHISANNFEP